MMEDYTYGSRENGKVNYKIPSKVTTTRVFEFV